MNLIKKSFYYYFCVVSFLISANGLRNDTNTDSGNCQRIRRSTKEVNTGWPAVLSCNWLIMSYSGNLTESSYASGESEENATNCTSAHIWPRDFYYIETCSPSIKCTIVDWRTKKTVWNETIVVESWWYATYTVNSYYTPAVTRNSTTRYQVMLWVDNLTCYYEEIILIMKENTKDSCQRALSSWHVRFEAEESRSHSLTCSAPDNGDSFPDIYDVIWYKNCSELPKKSSQYRQEGSSWNKTASLPTLLFFHNIGYESAGVYSCAVTYQEQKIFTTNYDFCVKQATSSSDSPIVIKCPKTMRIKLGQTASIQCTVLLGLGQTNIFSLLVNWKQVKGNSNHKCINNIKTTSIGFHNRTNCSIAYKHEDLKCYLYEPSEKIILDNSWIIDFIISDFKSDDAGDYEVMFSNIGMHKSAVIRLQEDIDNNELYIMIVVAVFVLIVFIIGLFIGYRICRS